MASPSFIGVEDIRDCYLPMGFSQFKIEGRGLGSALILEFLLHYLTKPEYQLHVREAVYLDNMLDLFRAVVCFYNVKEAVARRFSRTCSSLFLFIEHGVLRRGRRECPAKGLLPAT